MDGESNCFQTRSLHSCLCLFGYSSSRLRKLITSTLELRVETLSNAKGFRACESSEYTSEWKAMLAPSRSGVEFGISKYGMEGILLDLQMGFSGSAVLSVRGRTPSAAIAARNLRTGHVRPLGSFGELA
jgi:hypothetical protein